MFKVSLCMLGGLLTHISLPFSWYPNNHEFNCKQYRSTVVRAGNTFKLTINSFILT